jgi:cell division protein FtsA
MFMSGIKKPAKQSDLRVGIDFGTTKICVVIGKMTSEGVEIIGIGKQASLGIRKGIVVNIPSTVEALKKRLKLPS